MGIFSILAVVCIVAWSYCTLAPQFDPSLNSDQAIHILMAYHLHLPDDLYYWGQDRLGSLLPILGHFALKIMPLSPVVIVGTINYILVLTAYCCFASFFRQSISRILLAAALFLPLQPYKEILSLGQPYAGQFASIGLAMVGWRWLLHHGSAQPIWRRRLVMGLTLVSMTVSVWVSDFSVIYWAIMLGAIAYHLCRRISVTERRSIYPWSWPDGVIVGFIGIISISFLQFAKASALASSRYTAFNSLTEIADLATRMGQSVVRNLRFEGQNVGLAIAAYCCLGLIGGVIYWVWRYGRAIATEPSSLWLGSISLISGCSMAVLMLSNWVYNPDSLPQRYFVVIYVLIWIWVLLLVEQVPKPSRILMWGLLVVLAIAHLKTLPPRVLFGNAPPSRIVQLAELKPLAPAGFIGEYWHSYLLCSANPDLFHCTPYDQTGAIGCPQGSGQPYKPEYEIGSIVRCDRCVDAVLHSPTIYLVKQKWLDKFPKRIEQFGYCLERSGQSIKVAKQRMAPYRRLN